MSQHQNIKTVLQAIYGFKNPQKMITHAEIMYGPLRPATSQVGMNRTIQHVINANQHLCPYLNRNGDTGWISTRKRCRRMRSCERIWGSISSIYKSPPRWRTPRQC